MRSLRVRLILGSALVAVVPLAFSMLFLAWRLERAVRAEAAERLDSALGSLRLELGSDAERMAGQLRLVAQDPALRRLVLLRSEGGRELSDDLAERRFLIGVDLLSVADTSGRMIADGGLMDASGARADAAAWRALVSRRPAPDSTSIEDLAGAAALVMAASAPIRYERKDAGRVWGGRVLDRAWLGRLARASGMELVLRDAVGRPVATTLGESAAVAKAPDAEAAASAVERVTLLGRPYLSGTRALDVGFASGARITGLVPTAPTDRTIAAFQTTSALLGGVGLVVAVLLGLIWSSQVSRPVERLAAHSARLARGEWDEPVAMGSVRELETLVQALERMRRDLREHRDRLRVSERQAAWGQMARQVAHEVRNPLTPIAVAAEDLRRSFEERRPDFPQILDQAARTIADEVRSLAAMLQEFSEFARLPAPRFATGRVGELWSSLETLYARDVAEGRMSFAIEGREATISMDADQVRQALVNLIKNGLEATQGRDPVTVAAATRGAALEITVTDAGPGLTAEQRTQLFVPGFTTKPEGSGLGLTVVERIVNDHGGTIAVESSPGRGTTFRIRLPWERPPDPPMERS